MEGVPLWGAKDLQRTINLGIANQPTTCSRVMHETSGAIKSIAQAHLKVSQRTTVKTTAGSPGLDPA